MADETLDDDVIVTARNRPGRKVPDIVVRGIHERDILGLAPAATCDRIHWDTVEAFDIAPLIADLGPTARTRQWSDGQHRVWVPAGEGFEVRERIRQWCAAREVEPVNLRVEQSVPFRDLEAIPDGLFPELVAACVDWLYPHTYAVRHRIVAELDLIDDDDVRSLMYLFVHDHADRYDADRLGRNGTLNFTAFMFGKIRTWPQDAARTRFGRAVISDRIALHRARESALSTFGRDATEGERADALGVSVTELRRREDAISTLSSMRNYQELLGGETDLDAWSGVQVPDDVDVADEAISYERDAAVTRAVIDAVSQSTPGSRRDQDPLALAAVYLTFWEGLNRAEVARELDVLPKSASAAIGRVMERLGSTDLQ